MNCFNAKRKLPRFISGIIFLVFLSQPGFTKGLLHKKPPAKKKNLLHSLSKAESNATGMARSTASFSFKPLTGKSLNLNWAADPFKQISSIQQPVEMSVSSTQAQTNESSLPYWEWYPDDAVNLITSPSRWGALTWIRAAAMLGVGAGIYFHDTQIQSFFQRNRSGFTNDVASFATPFGEGAALPVLGILYWAHPNPKLGKTALLSLESFVIADAFTMGIKLIAHRARPYTGLPYNTFEGPSLSLNNDFLSFPSGHTTGAFAIASVIATEYRNVSYIPPLAYGVATLTGFARVNDNVHWASDVFVGGVIGYFTGKAITELHQNQDKKQSVLILPTAVQGSPGLLIGIHF
ncbi:MAG: phosphatase PAP2 family protein [Candidatus Eremiobacteraeota bacterium]|nr:phosphatase PAP2 family protein [Candidatus Eremiobacteraeota bacterium]MCL5055351.1 phosphatase PAP2 family protein [Bacillota bacterium]